MEKWFLLTPGPTPVPSEVLLEMANPIIHHRTDEFKKIFKEVCKDIKYLFQTSNDVIILASSGTGAMEASISNLFNKGDKVLVIRGGKFGDRWGEIAESFELNPVYIDVEWGNPVKVEDVKNKLKENPDIKGIFTQASETSTGIKHPVKEIAELVKDNENCLLIVDGITGVGVFDIKQDEWGIDVLISGSQKAFMLPPGLAFISLSEKAWKFAENSNLPKYYFDLKKERKNLKKGQTAYTPAVSLIIGLKKVLEMVKKEGLENIFERNKKFAYATREAFKEIGLNIFNEKSPSEAVTAVLLPEKVDGQKLVKFLRDEYKISIAGGQEHLKGKIIRISHMGFISRFDLIVGVSAVEMALKKFGYKFEFGKATTKLMELLK
jgi:aspartate aminotransferase-like enzyme